MDSCLTLTLVPFGPSHFTGLKNWFATEVEAAQWGGTELAFPVDDRQLAAMLDEGRSDPPARLCWMAMDGDETIGHGQLAFDWHNGTARLSRIAVALRSRGRGLAVPMLTLLIEEAFRHPEIERVELNVYTFNTPALRSYERVGLILEGVRRSSARVGKERWHTAMMAILRPEWSARGSARKP